MAIPIAAVISKAVEGTEEIKNMNEMDNLVSEARELTVGLWPEVGEQVITQSLSPEDIGREAWNKTDSINSKLFSDKPRYIITINESLENEQHPITGVPFEKKIIELPSGERIEGVFPQFDSLFDARINEDLYLESDKKQFKECNKQLVQAIESNTELRRRFTEEQIEQIYEGMEDGTAPDGYVWNHDAEPGKLQFVDFETHMRTGHTGGRYIWGGGTDNR